MGRIRGIRIPVKKEVLGVLGVVVAIAAGATLPIALSAAAGAHGKPAATAVPVASCSPPGISDTSTAVAAFSPPCIPALTVDPSTGLADGQTVTVTGTGFSANAEIGMAECEPGAGGESDCDLSNVLIVESDGNGDFSTPFTVNRILSIDSDDSEFPTQIDCAQTTCLLGAGVISDQTISALAPLSFNPNLPLALTGTLNKKGTVKPHAGVATISGTVTCATATTVEVDVTLTQFYKRFVFTNEVETEAQCSAAGSPWSVVVPPGNGLYGVGTSQAVVFLDAQVGTSFRQFEVTGKVALKKATKSSKK
jgi:neocarzinostatin family protein